MYIQISRSSVKGKTYTSVLLRESFRVGKKVKKRTIANFSHLPPETIELIRGQLKGRTYVAVDEHFEIVESRQHGAVAAVCVAFKKLDLMRLISSTPSRERNLVAAMIAARIIRPGTKLATTRWWQDTTLVDEFEVADATVDDLYAAMDWLLKRQRRIQAKLARRHLQNEDLVLYDLTSTYLEGKCCPLARLGYSRDGKPGKLQVCFGVLCDRRGRPVAVSVHRGNIRDHQTLMAEVRQLQSRYGIERLVMIGDRGMITQTRIDVLRTMPGIEWITALRSSSIGKLVRSGTLDTAHFDEVNLFEVLHPDYPGERLVACRNRQVARYRAQKREALLKATESDLEELVQRVKNGTLKGKADIGVAVGACINNHRMKKHLHYEIENHKFSFRRKTEKIAAEAALDGVYMIRTSLEETALSAADCVRSYKALSRVERAFRTLKTVRLKVRPIHHRRADRVRAHIFICTLAYYVEWHMREVWREVLFADPELDDDAKTRDPVAPAERSERAKSKIKSKKLEDGSDAYCFATLMEHLGAITRNRCRIKSPASKRGAVTDPSFELTTSPNEKQRQVLKLLDNIADMH